MTYEKFEYKAIGMLLEGDDPRLKMLSSQLLNMEVLLRYETETGFNIKYLSDATLATSDTSGSVFGLEVRLSDYPIAHLELIITNGLIDQMIGTYTFEMTYSEVIAHFDELTFVYENGYSPQVDLTTDYSTFDDGAENQYYEDEVFVDASTPYSTVEHSGYDETYEFDEIVAELVEEEDALYAIPAREEMLLPPSYSIPKVPEAIQDSWHSEKMAADDRIKEEERLKHEIRSQILQQQNPTNNRLFVKENVFSTTANNNYNEQKKSQNYESSFDLDDVLGGKLPQGPTNYSKSLAMKEIKEEKLVEKTPQTFNFPPKTQTPSYNSQYQSQPPSYNPQYTETYEIEEPPVRNLTPKELSDPNFRVENQSEIEPEVLEFIALAANDDEEITQEANYMRNRQQKIENVLAIILITLGIIFLIAFIFTWF